MGLINKVSGVIGVGLCLFAMFLYGHEMMTGGGYISNVKVKLVATYGIAPFTAHNFAATIILIVPLIAIAGTLPLRAKK